MSKRKEQFLKQQIATVGDNSDKFSRRMKALAQKIEAIKGGKEWMRLRGLTNEH